MRAFTVSFAFAFLLAASPVALSQSLTQDDNIRGGWLESRGKPGKRGAQSKPATKPKSSAPVSVQSTTAPAPSQTAATVEPTVAIGGLGIGYTLFKKDDKGEFVRANAQEVFKSGDTIRLLIETNVDGYLYIFSRENGEAPRLLYPNLRVQNGNNLIKAHEPFWLPDAGEIEFDGNPAKETLSLVFAETPLANVSPSPSLDGVEVDLKLYSEIARETDVYKVGNLKVGLRLTAEEGTRRVRIRKTAPAPAYILVNQDAKQSRIAANIQLIHN